MMNGECMRKIIVVLICLAFCVTLAACRHDQTAAQPDTVLGKWTTQIDLTETVNQMVYGQTGTESVTSYFPVTLILTLQQDGAYSVEIDRAELDAQLDLLGDVFWQAVVDQTVTKSQLSAADAEQALLDQGKNKELLMRQLNLESLFQNRYEETGVWTDNSQALYFAENAALLKGAEEYPYTLDTTLSVTQKTQDGAEKTVVFIRSE